MLLNAAVLVLLTALAYRLWTLSQFMEGGAKSGTIFFLTMTSGACLVANVGLPFLIAGTLITVMELRGWITQG